MTRAFATLALGGALALACATGSGGDDAGGTDGGLFPSEQELERVEEAPVPAEVFSDDVLSVREWQLEGPLPERISAERWLGPSRWDDLIAGLADASGGRIVPTEAMHCAAREYARFVLQENARPDHSVQRFIVGGCNAPVGRISFSWFGGEVGGAVDEEALFERWREPILSMLRSQTAAGERWLVGAAFASRDQRAVVYLAVGRPEVELEPVSPLLGRDRRFELRGRALGPAATIRAVMNRGPYAVAPCETVGDPKPPAFHFACAPDPADESTWVTLTVTPPNRILGRLALHALLSRRGRARRLYRRFAYAQSRPVANAETFTHAFVEALNTVRGRAGLRPVTLDVGQSEVASRVAPHFFAATSGSADEQLADVVSRGMLAGWDVEGTVRSGTFTFGAAPRTDDLSVLLSALLEEPTSRSSLLDPDIERVAVGPILSRADGAPTMLAAVVGGYALFDAAAHGEDADRLFARLAAARRERELPPPYRLATVWMRAMDAAGDVGGGEAPSYAMEDLVQDSAGALADEVHGWYAEAAALDAVEFPEQFLASPRLGAAIGVSHRKEPGDPWARYVVMIVAVTH